MDLLDSDSDSECKEDTRDVLNTDNNYAVKYDEWRGKEHLQKLKDKYGEDYEEDEESDDEDEDEDAQELTEEIEQDFFSTLASLKKKDPKIYDGKTEFFKENKAQKTPSQAAKETKVTIGDIERKVMLEKGGEFEEIEDKSIKFGQNFSYSEEMKNIKDSFKIAIRDEDEDDNLLLKREKSDHEKKEEAKSYKKWLAGQKTEVEDPEIEAKMEGLRDFWNKDDLDDGEKFLKDYLLNKRYLGHEHEQDDYVPRYDEIVHDSDDDLSEDEKNVKKQEEFEHKFNFRFEEPDEEFIKRYPRTIKNTLRKDEDKRKNKRKDIEERKKHEKEVKIEELKMLKSMKKKEIMDKLEKLKRITGNDDMELNEEDIEGDFDPAKYDKKMQEMFNNYDETAGQDEEKPTFSDLEDEDYEDDDIEDWDNWTGAVEENEDDLNCEDEGFNMDCDFQQEMIESTKGRKKGRRKSKFAEAIEQNTSKPVFDPNDKTFTEYVDEYYKLDCEDLIGDLPCRFKYRTVQQNDFGLSVEEVLAAPDKELNAWVSLRKTCQYRSEEEERKDFHVFRNKAKDKNLKKKVMPTLFEEPASGSASVVNVQEEKPSTEIKSKKKKKRKANTTNVSESKQPEAKKLKTESGSLDQGQQKDATKKKKRNKKNKKKNPFPNQSVIQVHKIAGLFEKNKKAFDTSNIKASGDIQISDERLKAYGINPNQYKRKQKREKYRKMIEQK